MDIHSLITECIKYSTSLGHIPSRNKIIEKFNISEPLARNIKFFIENKDILKYEDTIPDSVKYHQKTEGNEKIITTISARIKSEEDIIKYSQVDLSKWNVKSCELTSWEVTMGKKNTNTGRPETYTNFRVALKLIRKTLDDLSIKEQAEQFKSFIYNYKPDFSWIKSNSKINDNHMLEISLPDFHYGQLSWKPEVGENYDIKIASALWLKAVKYFAEIGNQYEVGKILLPLGHDWFNVNSATNTTFKGTVQDEDCRWKKTFSKGWMLIVRGIDILLLTIPGISIEIKIIPGNHDTERSYYLGEILKAYYRECNQVNIDNSPDERKYYQYGQNLIGMAHGDDLKIQDMPMTMIMEAKELFSKTSYWEFHHGHFHHFRRLVQDLVDNKCIIVKGMPSLVPLSVYSKKHAYMSVRQGIGTLWKKSGGIKAEFPFYPNQA